MTAKTYTLAQITSAFGALLTMALEGGDAITKALEVEDDGQPSNADVTGQLDSAGFPWDDRIHSSKKTQKSDGTWTAKKGAASLIPTVEAELRAKGYGGGVGPAVTTPVTPAATAPVVTPVAAHVAPINAPDINISAPVVETVYAKLCKLIADNSGVLNQEWVNKLFADNGFPGGLASLAGLEDVSKAFYEGILKVLPKA